MYAFCCFGNSGINERLQSYSQTVIVQVMAVIAVLAVLAGGISGKLALLVWCIGIGFTVNLHRKDAEEKTSHVIYEDNEELQRRYFYLDCGFQALIKADALWQVRIRRVQQDGNKQTGVRAFQRRQNLSKGTDGIFTVDLLIASYR